MTSTMQIFVLVLFFAAIAIFAKKKIPAHPIRDKNWLVLSVFILLAALSVYSFFFAYKNYSVYRWTVIDEPITAEANKEYNFKVLPNLTSRYQIEVVYKKRFDMFANDRESSNEFPDPHLKLKWVLKSETDDLISEGQEVPNACAWSAEETFLCLGSPFELSANKAAILKIKIIDSSPFAEIDKRLKISVTSDRYKDAFVATSLALLAGIFFFIVLIVFLIVPKLFKWMHTR
ncbi:MAG: hypothetical protein J0L93_04320 [Deltaproteobacteria bacterium]|nr:hypothetical protein [Deltaproteobacteria bacterium]